MGLCTDTPACRAHKPMILSPRRSEIGAREIGCRNPAAAAEGSVMMTSALRRPVVWSLPLLLAGGLVPVVTHAAPSSGVVRIETLSNRADLVSGGDALTRVVLPPGASAGSLRVSLDGADVTHEFAARPDGKVEGLLTGLRLGANTVVAKLDDGRGADLTITNHPIAAPVSSVPQTPP